jgi:N-methylhydantoinase B
MNDTPAPAASAEANTRLAAGDLEIIWSRLLSFMDEAATTMIRTAYSTTIRESRDLTVVLFDRRGRALAECAVANPSFIGTLPRTMAAFLAACPEAEWRDGDLVITNDPWLGSGHLNDISMATPIFLDRELLGFAAIAAHGPDIGGSLYSALSREVFEEGLRIPICHYARAGRREPLVHAFITANVRVPDKVVGDLEGMAACVENAARQVQELARKLTPARYGAAAEEIIRRSEAAMRAAIDAVPDGRFESLVTTSGVDGPLTIPCTITVAGDAIAVDFDGASPAQRFGINVPFCYTYAHTAYPIKCVFAPEIPNNHGTLRPIEIVAPEGSILNPRFPAPVAARHLTGQYLSAAVLLGLAECVPGRVAAESGVPRPQLVFSGTTDAGDRFVEHIFMVSGIGARAGSDGPNTLCFPANTTCTPIEIIETLTSLLIERKEMVPDSGGRGRWRGGCGQRMVVRNLSAEPIQLSVLAEMTHRGAQGLFGGGAGRPARIELDGTVLPDKAVVDFPPGSRLCVDSAGGGGYGAAAARDAEALRSDRREGYAMAPGER